MVGTGQISQTTWNNGTTTVGSNTTEFTGTIDGLGTGTMTMLEVLTVGPNGYTTTVAITGGTGDFEGITGTGTYKVARWNQQLHVRAHGPCESVGRPPHRPMRSELRLGPHRRVRRPISARTVPVSGTIRALIVGRAARRHGHGYGRLDGDPAARRRRPARLAEPAHARVATAAPSSPRRTSTGSPPRSTQFTNHVTGSLPCMPARHDILVRRARLPVEAVGLDRAVGGADHRDAAATPA